MTQMSSDIGLAILGAGIFAQEAYIPSLASLGSSAPPLRAVYSRSQSSAADLAEFSHTKLSLPHAPSVYFDGSSPETGLDALLARSDIHIVLVMLPINVQPAIILRALAAGKHVLSEKPIAPTVAAAHSLIATYEKEYAHKGLLWRVAENFEAEPGYRKVGELVKSGKIGRVAWWRMSAVNFVDENSKWYKTPWRTVPQYQGGFLLDGGVHSVAVLRTILPHPPSHLSSHATLQKRILAPQDTLVAIVRSAGSASSIKDEHSASAETTGIFELAFSSPLPKSAANANGTLITGTRGTLHITQAAVRSPETEPTNVLRATLTTVVEGVEKSEVVVEERVQGVEAELNAFFKAVRGEGDAGYGNLRGALYDVAFIEGALGSEGKEVEISKVGV